MTSARNYNSPLREDQMEQTRQRILETAAEMLADNAGELTVAHVAERAKVSVRTAYRYFPTKEALIDDLNDFLSKQWGSPPLVTSLEELAEMTKGLFESFERNERYVRARRRTELGDQLRARRKAEQVRAVQKVIAKAAPHYDDRKVAKLVGVFLNLLGSESWLLMRDTVGLSTSEAIEAVQWALDAVIAKIESERPRKGRK